MADNKELYELAFELYVKRVAAQPLVRNAEHEAIEAYRKAESFLAVRDKIKSGGLVAVKQDGPQLADCCAPNLSPKHPHNLVSQRFGDPKLTLVNRIATWLDKNHPAPDQDEKDFALRMNREFPDLSWDPPAINTARAIFPAYCAAK